jgi:hypothetical protein
MLERPCETLVAWAGEASTLLAAVRGEPRPGVDALGKRGKALPAPFVRARALDNGWTG